MVKPVLQGDATRGVLLKKSFLKISQNSQENTLFSCELCEIFKNTLFTEHLRSYEVSWLVTMWCEQVKNNGEHWIKVHNQPGTGWSVEIPPEVLLGKSFLEMCSKFTGEHPCWSVISIKLLFNFFEIAFRHDCSPVNLLHIFRTPFS